MKNNSLSRNPSMHAKSTIDIPSCEKIYQLFHTKHTSIPTQ